MRITRLSSPEFLKDLQEVDQWLTARGFSKRDRFRRYKASIEEIVECEQTISPEEIFQDLATRGVLSEKLTAYSEGMEFVRTLKTLISRAVAIPDELLERVLDGPWDAALEGPRSSRGRNATFEMAMGATAAHQGLQPILGQANPDIEFQFQAHRVLLECKRIFSIKGLIENIPDGINQLERCVQSHKRDVGLVAVSVSRLAHQGHGYFEAPSEETGRAFLSSALKRLVADFNKKIEALTRPSVAGVIFCVSSPFYIYERGFTVLTEGILDPFSSQYRDFLHDLLNVLKI